ncbi:MAG TPA: diadenylate cyclase CdaA [Bacillota bacterium]|jgi:diadenylate cyclase|nr:diadenylate cyclase CdaA [Bacillota bacterium]HQD79253.1 diadenylate cyclase CdaA [Bacillota bacterium]
MNLLGFDFSNITLMQALTTIADIAIVAFLMYKVISFLKGTQAVSLIKGLVVLFAANAISEYLKLDALHWLLRQATTMAIVGIPIVFQPEFRRVLEQLGRGRLFGNPMKSLDPEEKKKVLSEVARAVEAMSKEYIGALIVLEGETGLEDIAASGVKLDSTVSAELLINVFTPNTPLHDGAVILRGNRILAAACILPLSDRHVTGRKLGTRHRAALGLSERTDAVAVVVSEETGAISLANDGEIVRGLRPEELRDRLESLFDHNTKDTVIRNLRSNGR